MIKTETIKKMAEAINLYPLWTEGLGGGGVFRKEADGYVGAKIFAKYVNYLQSVNGGNVPDAKLESGRESNDFIDFLNREKESNNLDENEKKYLEEVGGKIITEIRNHPGTFNNKEVIAFAKIFEDLLLDESGNPQINVIGAKYKECLQSAKNYTPVEERTQGGIVITQTSVAPIIPSEQLRQDSETKIPTEDYYEGESYEETAPATTTQVNPTDQVLLQKQGALSDEISRIDRLIDRSRSDMKIGGRESVEIGQDGRLIANYSVYLGGRKSDNLLLHVEILPDGTRASSIYDKTTGQYTALNTGDEDADSSALFSAVHGAHLGIMPAGQRPPEGGVAKEEAIPGKVFSDNDLKGRILVGEVGAAGITGVAEEQSTTGEYLDERSHTPVLSRQVLIKKPQTRRAKGNRWRPTPEGGRIKEPLAHKPNQSPNSSGQPVPGQANEEDASRGRQMSAQITEGTKGEKPKRKKGMSLPAKAGLWSGGGALAYIFGSGGSSTSAAVFETSHNVVTGIIKAFITLFL